MTDRQPRLEVAMRRAISNRLTTLIRESLRNPGRALSKVLQFVTRPLFGLFTVYPLASRNRLVRECVFNAVHASGSVDLLCVRNDTERMVISSRDNVISRGVFRDGEFDFKKFVIAVELLRHHQKIHGKIDLLLDVGANIGSICIPSITRGHVARAMAIEPDPTNCRILKANIALNGLGEEIDVHEVAVGAADNQTLQLELSESNWGDHRIFVSDAEGKDGELARKRISIPSTTLDSLLRATGQQAQLMWMDTQGYEGHVLRGADESILRKRIPMAIEFWPYGMTRAGSYEFLKASISGYSGYYDLESPGSLRSFNELDGLFKELHAKGSFTDLLVI